MGYEFLGYISPSLLEGLDERRDRVKKWKLEKAVRDIFALEARKHSDLMENPETPVSADQRRLKKKKRERLAEEQVSASLAHLNEAWEWAVANFAGRVDHDFFKEVAKRIVPDDPNVQLGYRRTTGHTHMSGFDALAPSWEKIPNLMQRLFDEVNEPMVHPVEAGAHFHFRTAVIHPLDDGDGRSARLIEALLCYKGGYAPPIVREDQRDAYLSSIDAARKAFVENSSRTTEASPESYEISYQEQSFYEYLALKVRKAMDDAIGVLVNLPVYQVTLTRTSSIKSVRIVRDALSSRVRHICDREKHILGTVDIIGPEAGGVIRVIGMHDQGMIAAIIEGCPAYKGGYRIRRLTEEEI